jgi:hypothetical protein
MDWEEFLDSLFNVPTTYQEITVERIIMSLLVTFVMGMLIFYIYKKTFKGVLYNKNFNIGLVLTALVTAMIIIPISSNIALSLGMVGSLSIVRFRAAMKDATDVIFTFWAVAVGITCGAALYLVTIIATPVIGVIVVVLCKMDVLGAEPFLVVVHYESDVDKAVDNAVKQSLPKHKLRSRTVTATGTELMVEVSMKKEESSKLDCLLKIPGVKDYALVNYDGDYAS